MERLIGRAGFPDRDGRLASGPDRALTHHHRLVVRASEQVLDADFRPDHRQAEALFPPVGLGALPGPFPVAPAGPRRSGPGQPDGAGAEKRRQGTTEPPGPDLTLQQTDRLAHGPEL